MGWNLKANIKGPRGLKGDRGDKGLPGVFAVDNASAVAEYIETDTAVRDALNSDYSRLGVDSTQRLMALLKNETHDASMLVVGDSTGNEESEWVFLLAQALGADWPRWTVRYRLWNDTTQAYDAAVTMQTGASGRVFTIWNASVAGFSTITWQGARAQPALYSLTPDLVVVSLGHNEQTLAPDLWHSRYVALTEALASRLPGADLLLIAQNPATGNTNQQQRAEVYREIATRRGYGFVDVGQAFLDTGNAPALTLDGIHPNAAGTALWLATVKQAFVYQQGGRRSAQPPSTLSQRGENLLLNGDFSAVTSGAPDSWDQTGVTSVVDTVNFESMTINRVAGTSGTSTARKFTATAGAQGLLRQYVPHKGLLGSWVTLAVRVYIPAGQAATVARVSIADSTGSTLHTASDTWFGGYAWIVVSRFIPVNATYVRAVIYIDSSTGGGNCTIDRAILTPGKYPYGK